MNINKIIRTWKDEEYRLSLSDSERAALPANPAGAIELTDIQLRSAAGGAEAKTGYGEHCATPCSCCCFIKPIVIKTR
ncbi:MAG: mersacidin/lichenicidin family type 2 lantibiotic [Verrucomicrobia subdivision 3 bacterium]|nr:mersacidin/lichenicidin family type 2 lantibiotic [Limisphaerales bacterium]